MSSTLGEGIRFDVLTLTGNISFATSDLTSAASRNARIQKDYTQLAKTGLIMRNRCIDVSGLV
jgi:hypothetical protein